MADQFTKPLSKMTDNEAGALVDAVDRGHIKVPRETYDDLMMVASGHGALLADSRAEKTKNCVVCGVEFHPLRMSAAYCTPACSQRAKRTAKRLTHTST